MTLNQPHAFVIAPAKMEDAEFKKWLEYKRSTSPAETADRKARVAEQLSRSTSRNPNCP